MKPADVSFCTFGILAVTQLLRGMNDSLMSPFYSKEAVQRGMSITETGVIYSCRYLVIILSSPLFGKNIERIGSRKMFIVSTIVSANGNFIFGILHWIEGKHIFFGLSLAIRTITSLAETALGTAIIPLTIYTAGEGHTAKVLGIMESLLGFGTLTGPFIGGILYHFGGFYLPFISSGGAMALCSIMALSIHDPRSTLAKCEVTPVTKFSTLLRIPQVVGACLHLGFGGLSFSWYVPVMQPFLETEFHLSVIEAGGILMLDGVSYALATPFWGWAIDASLMSPLHALFIGSLCIIVGYSLFGLAPFPFFSPYNVYVVAIGMLINGIGVASIFLITYLLMLSSSTESGFVSNSEQTQGMLTSLWYCFESLGGYIGTSCSGWAYDVIGFQISTLIIIGAQVLSMLNLCVVKLIEHGDMKANRSKKGYQHVGDMKE